MAARTVPTEPSFTTESEAVVWRHLVSSLGPDDVVLANQRLTDESKEHELDLVVLMADVGIVVAEVKGGSVTVDDQGRWWQGTGDRRRRIHRDQAREGKYALHHYVESDPRWRKLPHAAGCGGPTPWSPRTRQSTRASRHRTAPGGRFMGAPTWAELPQRLRAAAPQHGTGHRAPSGDDVDLL